MISAIAALIVIGFLLALLARLPMEPMIKDVLWFVGILLAMVYSFRLLEILLARVFR